MKVAAFLGLMITLIPIRTFGQELLSTLSITAEAGYLTNTYLHPVLPLWVAADAPFLGLAPTASLAWTDRSTYAGIEGQLRLTELTDRQEIWWMGSSQARVHRRIGQRIAIGIDGAVSRIEMGVDQWLAWGGPYATASMGNRVQLTTRLGSSYRRHDAVQFTIASEQLSYFAVAQLALLASSRWNFYGHVYGTRSASTTADPFGTGGTIKYTPTRDLWLGLDVGAEWFGQETSNWQGAASMEWEMSSNATWTGRFGVQQFVQENEATPDVFAAVGFTYRLQSRRDLSPPPPLTWRQLGDEITLRYVYEGDHTLYLVGDFNNWNTGETVLQRAPDDVYTARITLRPGTYEYKIVAVEDGTQRWMPLPEEVLTTDDNFGGTNGILIVE